jgi:hypothetical protein
MKYSLFPPAIFLSAGSNYVNAFSTPTPSFSGAVTQGFKIFEGVHLPDFFVADSQAYWDSQTNWEDLDTSLPALPSIIGTDKPGKEKTPWPEAILNIHSSIVEKIIRANPDDPAPCDGYLYFGNQEHTEILSKLCQVNPFWASALTVSGDNDEYLELNAYSELPKSDSDPKYMTLVRALADPSHRINLRFNKDMTVNQIVNYESGEGVIVPKEEWDYYASGVCYNMFYYSSCIHALFHVLHYHMTIGIAQSTNHDESLKAWANPYDDNVSFKYLQVAGTLFESNVNAVPPNMKILTGKDALGGSTEIMPPLRKILSILGACKTEDDFTRKFLLKDLYTTASNPKKAIKTADILSEYSKHSKNIEPFAKSLVRAMAFGRFRRRKRKNKKSFKHAEDKLRKFMTGCGEDVFSIDSISSWVQLMSCTGTVHGSTLSYSRMMFTPEVIRWRNINEPTYSEEDVIMMVTLSATLQGMLEDRHTFSGEIVNSDPEWDTSSMSKKVKRVLNKYDGKAGILKKKYEAKIVKRDDFREFGWILTDHCNDGFDGKQHTMTTYL